MSLKYYRSLVLLVIGLLFCVAILETNKVSKASGLKLTFATQGSRSEIMSHSSESARPWLNLKDGYRSQAVYKTGGNDSFNGALDPSAKPLSMSTGDLNQDGFPDLATGYAVDKGGIVVLRFADPEAFGPTRSETIEGIKNGRFPATFLSEATVLQVPEAADFLSIGDFDRDGKLDILTAALNSTKVNFSSLNEKGAFDTQWSLSLPGQLTTLATGRDVTSPHQDLAVGIVGEAGSQALFYSTTKSVLEEIPAIYDLPTVATSIALGQLDDKVPTDLAVAAGNQMLIIHGSGGNSPKSISLKSFYQSQIERIDFPAAVTNLAVGDFIPDRVNRMELAVLTDEGTIRIEARGKLNTIPFTKDEMLARRQRMAEMRRTGNFGTPDFSPWRPERSESWNETQTLYSSAPAAGYGSKNLLVGGNIAATGGEELIVVNSGSRQAEIFMNDSDVMTGNIVSLQRTSLAIDIEGTPIAALVMRTGVIGQPGLTILTTETDEPIVMTAAPEAIFDIDRNDDTAAATTCGAGANDCSLRGAVLASNSNGVGGDMITFSSNLPILTVVGNDNSGNTGDLDINGNLTVMGSGSATTIVSTTYPDSGSNDQKIFGVNQDGLVNGLGVSFSGVTIQNGLNRSSCGAFLETGGGGDFFLTGTGNTYSVTNIIVKNSTAKLCAASHGGGINVDSAGSGTVGGPLLGTMTISNSTFMSNKSDAEGGGLSLFADKHDVVISNSTFGGVNPVDGNQAQPTAFNGVGGGLFVGHSFGGTVTINGTTTIRNNTSARAGGGIAVINNQNFSLSGTATISNNTATSGGAGSSTGGGVIISLLGVAGFTPTVSLTGCTISNNHADNGAAAQGGGVYFNSFYSATVSNCTISGNTSARGAGVFNGGSSATPAATLTINSNSIISGNTASGPGGGLANVDSIGASTILNGIAIDSNISGSGGSGIDQTLEGGGTGSTMTLQGTINVNGGNSINIGRGTFNSSSGTLNLTGNFTRDSTSTFNHTGGTVNFNGTNTQTIGGTGATTFNNLAVSNTVQPLNVNTNVTASGNLTINANAILNPAAAILIGGSGTLTGNGTARVTRTAATADFLSQYTITNKTLTNLTVDYAGSSAQTINTLAYGGLRLNNISGATLTGATSVGGNLNLVNGILATGANTLTVTGTGTSSRTNGYVSGNLRKDYSGPGSFIFASGTASGYAPVETTITAGAGNLTVTGIQGPMPLINGSQALQRYWTLVGSGITANLVFVYNQGEVMGDENLYLIHRQVPPAGPTQAYVNLCPGSPCVDTVTNRATVNGVTQFSNWTVAVPLAPTASSAPISGRVLTIDGRGISRAQILVTNSIGQTRLVTSNSFGYYRIDQLMLGQSYVLQVQSKEHVFTPQSIELFDEISNLNFIAQP